MDNIRAAMIIDRGMSPLEEEVRQKAIRTVTRMCPDHENILTVLGLAEEPPPAGGAEVETCKRGHPKIPENLRRHKGGWRCRACEQHTKAERKERRAASAPAQGKTQKPGEPRPTDRSSEWDIARSAAMKEAKDMLGMSWDVYRSTYGCRRSTAEAVAAAAAVGDADALEALKKENR
jgi:hypothetical protein